MLTKIVHHRWMRGNYCGGSNTLMDPCRSNIGGVRNGLSLQFSAWGQVQAAMTQCRHWSCHSCAEILSLLLLSLVLLCITMWSNILILGFPLVNYCLQIILCRTVLRSELSRSTWRIPFLYRTTVFPGLCPSTSVVSRLSAVLVHLSLVLSSWSFPSVSRSASPMLPAF